MRVTMKKVAELAGTSQPTVSDVLRGHAEKKGIRPETAERVRKAAKKLGYRPNWLAQSLVRGRTGVIGVHFPTYSGDHHKRLILGVDLEAQARGYRIILSAPTLWDRERTETIKLLDHGLDGLIVYPLVERKMAPALEQLQREGLAISLIAAALPKDIPHVIDDNVGEAKEAMQHLIHLGHRRIGFIGRSNATRDSRERRQGYREAMDEAGLARPSAWVIRHVSALEELYATLVDRLKRSDAPTAFYCADDHLAASVMVALRQLGLKAPDDVALVGHGDDLPESVSGLLGLTTIRQDTTAIANHAVNAIVDQLDGKTPTPSIRVPGRLVVRQSCGAAGVSSAKQPPLPGTES